MNDTNTSRQLNIVAGLPKELLDYLWDLVREGKVKKRSQALVTLRPAELGGAALQEVRLYANGREEVRRVFGFEPVTADIGVEWKDGNCLMQLIGWGADCV